MQSTTSPQPAQQDEMGRRFTKRIGSTIYRVTVHFKPDAKETLEDKLLRLMENEVRESG